MEANDRARLAAAVRSYYTPTGERTAESMARGRVALEALRAEWGDERYDEVSEGYDQGYAWACERREYERDGSAIEASAAREGA